MDGPPDRVESDPHAGISTIRKLSIPRSSKLEWDPRPALCVVAASGGYPGKYKTGLPITGIVDADALPDVKVFQAGTRADGNRILTDGGRVLSVCALGDTLADAQRRAYEAIKHVHFDGLHYRKDIGHRALRG